MIWVEFAGVVGLILVMGWAFMCDFDEWWNGHRVDGLDDEVPGTASEPAWVAETLAEIHRLPEVVHR